jgi:ATP-dependent Clp protease ATP-binding subunit ClpA
MIAYITQMYNIDNRTLPAECPWTSWQYVDGSPLPDNAIVVSDEEFAALYAQYEPVIMMEKDRVTMAERSRVKDELIGKMGAENKQRVRDGTWTVTQLIELTQDAQLKLVLDDINSLSFELAQSKIMAITNPLITMEIKMSWVKSLQDNLFL